MALNLSKKTLRTIIIIVIVLSIGATGYIIWRIQGEEQVIPLEGGAAYDCLKNGVPVPCSTIGQIRCHCDNGSWIIGTGSSCWTLCGTNNANTPTRVETNGGCTQGSQCAACEWPNVAYCGCSGDSNPSHRQCGCRAYNSTFSCGTQCGNISQCTPGACPSGWTSCGLSGSSGAGASGCVAKTECKTACPGCSNESIVRRYCMITPKVVTPICGDGILGNTSGEECELNNPSGVSCSWDSCNHTTCTCPEPSCGDGIFGNTDGEECELDNPDGVTCSWDICNQDSCSCPAEVSCGDGILGNTEGEECELDDPDGVTCSWNSCNQDSCSCPDEVSCGDGILGNTDGEECELGDPSGVSCLWSSCNKDSCGCPEDEEVPEVPELPETGIDDISEGIKVFYIAFLVSGGILVLSYVFEGPKKKYENRVVDRLNR